MPLPKNFNDHADVKRLILQIERDLLRQTRLKTILLDAGDTIAGHRQELRTLRGRLTRAKKKGVR